MSEDRGALVVGPVAVPLSEFAWEYARSGGPGGQNVNKVNSKATLRWPAANSPSLSGPLRDRFLALAKGRTNQEGELLISSQKTRDQGRNVEDCLEKLRALIDQALKPPVPRRPTRPSKSSQIERVEGKRKRSQTKSDRGARHEGGD